MTPACPRSRPLAGRFAAPAGPSWISRPPSTGIDSPNGSPPPAAPFADSIDGHLAHHDLPTSHAGTATSRGGVTLSDGGGQEERAPTRRSGTGLGQPFW